MASHHHHQHHCQNPLPTSNCAATCCYCNHHCCTQFHHSPSPQQPQLPIDPLIQALASLLQQQQQQQQQESILHASYYKNPQTHKNHHQKHCFHPQKAHFQQQDDNQQAQYVFSSLLQRINNLESSLHHFSTAYPTRDAHHFPSFSSLKDAAARVIQTHFRAFLVRRSRTLSQLKELAIIKSSFNSLKSSISNKTHFDFEAVSHKAMALLLKLDSIQGGDPMIRDGKRSIGRDLVRFLEFIDGFVIKRHAISYKPVKSVKFVKTSKNSRALYGKIGYGDKLSGHDKEIVGKLRESIERVRGFSKACENEEEDVELEGFQQCIDEDDEYNEDGSDRVCGNGETDVSKLANGVLVKGHGVQPRGKKTVRFKKNGNSYVVFGDTDESVSNGDGSLTDGSDSSDNHGDVVENQFSEAEERKRSSKSTRNAEEAHLENGGSLVSSYGQRNCPRSLGSNGDAEVKVYCHDQDGSLVFSAPVPVKMESIADLVKKNKPVKIVR